MASENKQRPGSPGPTDGPPPTPSPDRDERGALGWGAETEEGGDDPDHDPDHPHDLDDARRDGRAPAAGTDAGEDAGDAVSPRQLALLASMVEEAVRTIPTPDPAASPPRTPAFRADDDDGDEYDDAADAAGDRAPARGREREAPLRGAYPDPTDRLSPRPPAQPPRRRRHGRRRPSASSTSSDSGSSSSSSASSSSSSSDEDEDDDGNDAADHAREARAVGRGPSSAAPKAPGRTPPPPGPPPLSEAAPKPRAAARTPAASAGRIERRRARAAVAGRDATGRFTAGQPRRVELDADAASGAFYARYRDGYVSGEPWPGAGPPPPGRVLYGGLGDSRPGLWGAPEAEEARRRFEASGAPAAVWAPELGDAAQQYALITRLLYTPDAEAMGWLQNPRVVPGDVALDQACFRISGAARNSSSFITGSVARAVPHLGYAMAAGRFGWGLAHAAAAVAMSRRYDRAQKGFLLTSLRRAYAPLLARENAALTGAAGSPGAGADDEGVAAVAAAAPGERAVPAAAPS